MAELQTSYAETQPKAFKGMVANGETSNRISRTLEDSAALEFGEAVYRGSGDHGCTATVGTLATFLGWSVGTSGQGLLSGGTADTYAQYDNVTIITGGAVYIEITGQIDDGDPVTVGTGGGAADGYGDTAADATHIATGWVADETVTDDLCRIVKR